MCVRVASRSKPGRFYDVDPSAERCQCVAWNFRSDCWHIGEARRMTEPKENIHTAIAAAYKECGYVLKEKSAGLNYSYAGESALIEALRPVMVDNGIYVHVLSVAEVKHETYVTTKGSPMNRVSLLVTVRFTHAPSGTFIDVVAPGEGADSGDKATAKSATSGFKYALRQTFCIETGDDPDKTPSSEQERAPKSQDVERVVTQPAERERPSNGDGIDLPAPSPTDMTWFNALTSKGKELGVTQGDFATVVGGVGAKSILAWLNADETRSLPKLLSAAVDLKESRVK